MQNLILKLMEQKGFKRIAFLSVPTFLSQWKILYDEQSYLDLCVNLQNWLGKKEPEGTFVLAALPYWAPENQTPPQKTSGSFAPFAQKHYYKEAVRRLQQMAAELISSGIKKEGKTLYTKKDFPIFSNSRLPEKQMACFAGIGFFGKNSLVIAPGLGSRFILSGIYLPFPLKDVPPEPPPAARCGSCQRCVKECPAGAIRGDASHLNRCIETELCFQNLATKPVTLEPSVMKKWQNRLYGCDECQKVCPFNKSQDNGTDTDIGILGTQVSLAEILSEEDSSLKARWKKSVLGPSWIDIRTIKRNALIAAGNSGDPSLLPIIHPYTLREETYLKATALWSIERIKELS